MRRYGLFLGVFILCMGCSGTGGSPSAPRVYVIGVDTTRSFWHSGMVTQRKPAVISREQALVIVGDLRDCINKINVASDEKNFVMRTQRESGDFIKQFDREGLRKSIENSTDMVVALANGITNPDTRIILADEVGKSLTALSISMTKFDFERTKKLEKFDETLNPQSVQRIKTAIERARADLDKFTYAVAVPDKPETMKLQADEVTRLVELLVNRISERNRQPLNPEWVKMGVYGSITELSPSIFFSIGTSTGTICQPSAAELNSSLKKLAEQSAISGWKVFSAGTDYGTFFKRSFMEIQNLITTWGTFDKDIGIELSYIIIGDGKNDPLGTNELTAENDKTLIDEVKSSFGPITKTESVIGGIPWENIKSVSVTFCVPKKQYSTEVLDYWTKMLQDAVPDNKARVRYFMFDALQDNGEFNYEKLLTVIE